MRRPVVPYALRGPGLRRFSQPLIPHLPKERENKKMMVLGSSFWASDRCFFSKDFNSSAEVLQHSYTTLLMDTVNIMDKITEKWSYWPQSKNGLLWFYYYCIAVPETTPNACYSTHYPLVFKWIFMLGYLRSQFIYNVTGYAGTAFQWFPWMRCIVNKETNRY